ncbi:MAG TPA: hypothetical protein VNS63_12910 [Blastocatellia bacterium]|nr:hypothetical protein [Blastocatellia bacterium]
MAKTINMERRLRIAGTLVVLGLLIELISLLWSHPIAFIVFVAAGGLLIGVGIVIYLYSLVSGGESVVRENDEVKAISVPK